MQITGSLEFTGIHPKQRCVLRPFMTRPNEAVTRESCSAISQSRVGHFLLPQRTEGSLWIRRPLT